MALDWQRPPRRYRVYLTLPSGARLLWDDEETPEAAQTLGTSTFMPYQVLDTENTELPWRQLR